MPISYFEFGHFGPGYQKEQYLSKIKYGTITMLQGHSQNANAQGGIVNNSRKQQAEGAVNATTTLDIC